MEIDRTQRIPCATLICTQSTFLCPLVQRNMLPMRHFLSFSRPRSDVVGFTEIAAQCSAMEVCAMLNDMYTRFDGKLPDFPDIFKVRRQLGTGGFYAVATVGTSLRRKCQ